MEKKYGSITKKNSLIEKEYKLSLSQMQLISFLFSTINPFEGKDDYYIYASNFLSFFNLNNSRLQVLKVHANSGKFSLFFKNITIDSQRIAVTLSKDIKSQLFDLQGDFTTYPIKEIRHLKSFASIRLFEIFTMYLKKFNKSKISVQLSADKLAKLLINTNKKTRPRDIDRIILKRSIHEINLNTSLNALYRKYSSQKKPALFEFFIEDKTKKDRSIIIKQASLRMAEQIMLDRRMPLTIDEISKQFIDFTGKKKEIVYNIDKAFIGFVSKKSQEKIS